jgi:hypothetical protein
MSRAARRAHRPVNGVEGSKAAADELLVDEEPGALDAPLGLVLGAVCFVAQV